MPYMYMYVLHVLYKSSRNANMHHNFMREGYALPSAFHILCDLSLQMYVKGALMFRSLLLGGC